MSFLRVHSLRGASSKRPRWFLAGYTGSKPVNVSSLHARYLAATLTALTALVGAEGAGAHVDVQPSLLEQGAVAELRVELPQLRPGPQPQRLGIRAPGAQLLESRLLQSDGNESRWLVRVRVDGPLGELPLMFRAVYADGEVVEVDYPLTVVPASQPSPSAFPWAATAIGVALAAGVAFAVLRVARRKAW